MAEQILTIKGLKEFEAAIRRNPQVTLSEARNFLVRGIAVYNRLILRNPWRVGGAGGGAPVDTGNLRDTHRRKINRLSAEIYPSASYAKYVHGRGYGEINKRTGVKSRPWLDYAMEKGDRDIKRLSVKMLSKITHQLSK